MSTHFTRNCLSSFSPAFASAASARGAGTAGPPASAWVGAARWGGEGCWCCEAFEASGGGEKEKPQVGQKRMLDDVGLFLAFCQSRVFVGAPRQFFDPKVKGLAITKALTEPLLRSCCKVVC